MADIRAAQTGNFSATTTWVGGVVPGSGDIAYSNTFTVTVDGTFTVQAVSNATGTSITTGGTFVMANGASLISTNANGVLQGTTTTPCITTTGLTNGQSATLTAGINGLPSLGSYTAVVSHSGGGTLTITTTGLTLSQASGSSCIVNCSGSGVLNVNGPVNGINFSNVGSGIATIIGSGTACNIIINGNLTGGTGTNNATYHPCLRLTGSGATAQITGALTGSSTHLALVCVEISGANVTLTVTGTVSAGASANAIVSTATSAVIRLSGPILLGNTSTVATIYSASGWRWIQNRAPSYMQVRNWNNTVNDNLYTSDGQPTGGYPTAANVLNTAPAYGDAAQYTGTYVPVAASSVATGVVYGPPSAPLTGTAILTAANVRAAVGMASANLDTQLAGKATVDQVASIVQGATSA